MCPFCGGKALTPITWTETRPDGSAHLSGYECNKCGGYVGVDEYDRLVAEENDCLNHKERGPNGK